MLHRFIALTAALAVVAGSVSAQVLLNAPVSVPSGISNPGPGPRGVAASDLDGDRFPDLVICHGASSLISILLNDGVGGFLFLTTVSVGADPRAIACGDLDNDGRNDIVVANAASNDVSVIMNQGGLVFSAAMPYSVGTDPRGVAVADLNGDGDLDIVTPNNLSSDVSVLLNAGGAGFAPAVTFVIGGAMGPREATPADLNGDGALDLAVASSTSGDVTILLNNGAGGFTVAATLSTLSSFTDGVKAGDMDGDGDLDLVASNFLPSNLSVFINIGGGSFASANLFNDGVHLQGLDLADMDFDGDLDVVVVDVASDTTRVSVNDGTGSLTPSFSSGSGSFPTDVLIADVDGDFIGDVIVSNFMTNDVAVMTNALSGPVLGDCGAGTVGTGAGGPFDVLLLNGTAGGAARRVDVAQGSVVQVDVLQSPASAAQSPFLIWGMLGEASSLTVTSIPFSGVGDTCLVPFHLFPGFPGAFVLTNNFFPDPASLVSSVPTPWGDFLQMPAVPFVVTLQGLILDSPGVLRLTNGVILNVQ